MKSALVSEEFTIEKVCRRSSPQTLDQAVDVIDHIVTSVEAKPLYYMFLGRLIRRKVSFTSWYLLRFFHGFRIKEVL